MISTRTLLSHALCSFALCGALGSTIGCDAQDPAQSADDSPDSSGKSDDASGTLPNTEPDPDGCTLKAPEGGCECTYAEYKDGCGQCDADSDDCDKTSSLFLAECAPSVSAVAVACGERGFNLLRNAATLNTMAALQDFWMALFDNNCKWAIQQASQCMFDGWLGVSSVGIMWDYNACSAQGRADCCVADSQCSSGICGDSGACIY